MNLERVKGPNQPWPPNMKVGCKEWTGEKTGYLVANQAAPDPQMSAHASLALTPQTRYYHPPQI